MENMDNGYEDNTENILISIGFFLISKSKDNVTPCIVAVPPWSSSKLTPALHSDKQSLVRML